MSEGPTASSISHLMQMSTLALYDCQKSLSQNTGLTGSSKLSENIDPDQAQLLLHLVETLVDTKIQLAHEIESERVIYIDPTIVSEMEVALELATADPLDEKINQIYFSIFGYNSALWHVLRDMQKLLKTLEVLKDPRGKRVAKVDKKQRERRKKRNEKETTHSSDMQTP